MDDQPTRSSARVACVEFCDGRSICTQASPFSRAHATRLGHSTSVVYASGSSALPRENLAHWAPRYCLECSSQPTLTIQARQTGDAELLRASLYISELVADERYQLYAYLDKEGL